MAQFSLSWELHKQSICGGLSILQQQGEFVDMTLAADGHHVKVHQMIMSLASPYIKDILSTIHSSHPVIFLNKISYTTLCALLEYIYTGEVLISKENLPELVEAGKDLHITGLKDMKLELSMQQHVSQTMQAANNRGQPLSETGYFDNNQTKSDESVSQYKITKPQNNKSGSMPVINMINDDDDDVHHGDDSDHSHDDMKMDVVDVNKSDMSKGIDTQIQYTISNQGALQMILNRYMYYLRYTSRKSENGHRQWRCVDYVKGKKCPATVITRDDVVVQRIRAHNHTFHDQRILKKVRDNAVYSALTDAEQLGQTKKQQRIIERDTAVKKTSVQIDDK